MMNMKNIQNENVSTVIIVDEQGTSIWETPVLNNNVENAVKEMEMNPEEILFNRKKGSCSDNG